MEIKDYVQEHTRISSSAEDLQVCKWLKELEEYRKKEQDKKDTKHAITLGFLDMGIIAAMIYSFGMAIGLMVTKSGCDCGLYVVVGFLCIVVILVINDIDLIKSITDKIKYTY